jgi:arginine deiminase
MRDVIYWPRHADPHTGDLVSAAGNIYAFSVNHYQQEVDLVDAVLSADMAKKDHDQALDNLKKANQRIAELEKKLLATQHGTQRVETEVLRDAYSQREMYQDFVNQTLTTNEIKILI